MSEREKPSTEPSRPTASKNRKLAGAIAAASLFIPASVNESPAEAAGRQATITPSSQSRGTESHPPFRVIPKAEKISADAPIKESRITQAEALVRLTPKDSTYPEAMITLANTLSWGYLNGKDGFLAGLDAGLDADPDAVKSLTLLIKHMMNHKKALAEHVGITRQLDARINNFSPNIEAMRALTNKRVREKTHKPLAEEDREVEVLTDEYRNYFQAIVDLRDGILEEESKIKE